MHGHAANYSESNRLKAPKQGSAQKRDGFKGFQPSSDAYYGSGLIFNSSTGIRVVGRDEAPALYSTVESVLEKADVSLVSLLVLDSRSANCSACTYDKDAGFITIYAGLVDMWKQKVLQRREFEAIIAHEASHIKHNDFNHHFRLAAFLLPATFIASAALFQIISTTPLSFEKVSAIVYGAALVSIFAPDIVLRAVSKSHEYRADLGAAKLGYAADLASYIRKVDHWIERRRGVPQQIYGESYSFLDSFVNDARSHPPEAKRIKRLEKFELAKSANK